MRKRIISWLTAASLLSGAVMPGTAVSTVAAETEEYTGLFDIGPDADAGVQTEIRGLPAVNPDTDTVSYEYGTPEGISLTAASGVYNVSASSWEYSDGRYRLLKPGQAPRPSVMSTQAVSLVSEASDPAAPDIPAEPEQSIAAVPDAALIPEEDVRQDYQDVLPQQDPAAAPEEITLPGSADTPAGDPAGSTQEDAADNTPESPAENNTVDPAEDITLDPAENVPENPAENITLDPAENAPENPAEDITVDPAENVPENPAENITLDPAEAAPEAPEKIAVPEDISSGSGQQGLFAGEPLVLIPSQEELDQEMQEQQEESLKASVPAGGIPQGETGQAGQEENRTVEEIPVADEMAFQEVVESQPSSDPDTAVYPEEAGYQEDNGVLAEQSQGDGYVQDPVFTSDEGIQTDAGLTGEPQMLVGVFEGGEPAGYPEGQNQEYPGEDVFQEEAGAGDLPTAENPEQPVTENPEQPVTENPEQPVTEDPEQPATENPDQTITESPELTIIQSPEQIITESPEQPITENPDQTVTENPEQSGDGVIYLYSEEEIFRSERPADDAVGNLAVENAAEGIVQGAATEEIPGEAAFTGNVTETVLDVTAAGDISDGQSVPESSSEENSDPQPLLMQEGDGSSAQAVGTDVSGEAAEPAAAVFVQIVETELPQTLSSSETVFKSSVQTGTEQSDIPAPDGVPENVDGFLTGASSSANGYFTDADGVVQIRTTLSNGVSHTGMYLFDKDGYMLTGEQTSSNKTYYLLTEKEAKLDSGVSASEGKTPFNSTYGQVLTSSWRWDETGGVFKRYGSDGAAQTIAQTREQFMAQGNFHGYFSIGSYQYALADDGKPRTGTVKLTGSDGKTYTYFFLSRKDSNGIYGRMFHEGWRKDKTSKGICWRYFSQEAATLGRMLTHGVVIASPNGSKNSYMLNKNGYVIKNACKKISGKYYQTNKKGIVLKDKFATYKKNKYYYGSDGARVTWKKSWHRVPGDGNRYYFFGGRSQIVKKTGWQKIYSDTDKSFVGWFYFDNKGRCKINTWLSKNVRYATSSGKLAEGVTTIKGVKYYFTPSTEEKVKGQVAKKKLVTEGNSTYYATNTGALKKNGWIKTGGFYYHIKNYKALKNQADTHKGVKGYLDNEGRFMSAGWNIVDDKNNFVKYVNPSTGEMVRNTSMSIDGYTYYFDSNGFRINDVTDRVSGPYYLECDRVNGVITVYNNSGKTIPVKSIRVSVGAAGTETPTGTFSLTPYGRWVTLMGPTYGQYGSLVTGNILIHSVPMQTASLYAVPRADYAMLGNPASHGCIRACVADTKWVYENCGGCTIRIFDGTYKSQEVFKGPLGRNRLVPMAGTDDPTYDPTDAEAIAGL